MRLSKSLWFGFLFACLTVGFAGAKAQVPTPVSVLGHTPGDDFYLAGLRRCGAVLSCGGCSYGPDEDVFDREDDGGARD